MNQQTLDMYLERFKGILKKVQNEVKKLKSKEEELNRREQDIRTIKENTTQILQLLQGRTTTTTNIERKIQSLNKTKEIEHSSSVYSITELSNARMATGDWNGYIRLFAVDAENGQWTTKKEEKGHDRIINSLCELSRNRLVSSSSDNTLKVWDISKDTLTPIKTLQGHNDIVHQVIPLTMDIIASGSWDRTIKIWDVTAYKEVQTLGEDFDVCSLLKLKNKNEMVAGGTGKNIVSFWNTITFTKEHTVECCDCLSYNGLIELPNGCVAVSGGSSSTIDVIDTKTYQRVKQIQCEGYIGSSGGCSSLHLLSNGTFIYSHRGCFCQISSTTYEVLYKDKKEKEFGEAMTSTSNGKYIIAHNYNCGVSIFKIEYN